jgi:integrase
MANKKGHRPFGNVRSLPSGRFQARYIGPDGLEHKAPNTFPTSRAAAEWLTVVQSEIIKGEWLAPEAGQVRLNDYGERWLRERKLRPRTRIVYQSIWRLHIVPFLGHLELGEIRPATIRSWRAALLKAGRSEGMAARSYALLRAMLSTAVKQDEILTKNPCRVRGFDQWIVPERPTASVDQVDALAVAMPPRFAALITCAAFLGLRWSELLGLRRCDVDLRHGTVRVVASKSHAGIRTVALPAGVTAALGRHLATFVDSDPEAHVFTGERGGKLTPSNWRRAVRWREALTTAGLPASFHFHDLRHTGNNLAAASGASTRELMHRMGHATVRAALVYQHANSARDHEIARAIEARIASQRTGSRIDAGWAADHG